MMLPTATSSSPATAPAATAPLSPADDREAQSQDRRPYRKPMVVTHSREDLEQAATKVNACVSF